MKKCKYYAALFVLIAVVGISNRLCGQAEIIESIVQDYNSKRNFNELYDSVKCVRMIMVTDTLGLAIKTDILVTSDGKSSQIISVEGQGEMTMTYNGEKGWILFPGQGIETPMYLEGPQLDPLKSTKISDFFGTIDDVDFFKSLDTVPCLDTLSCLLMYSEDPDENEGISTQYFFDVDDKLLVQTREFAYADGIVELEPSRITVFSDYRLFDRVLYPATIIDSGPTSVNYKRTVTDLIVNPEFDEGIFNPEK